MKIIILKGESDTGKTNTLSIAYNKLLSLSGKREGKQEASGNTDRDGNDFQVLVSYNDKKIFFHSVGDENRYVLRGLEIAKTKKADILISACNNTCFKDVVNKISETPFIVEKTIRTETLSGWDANMNDVDKIIELI